MLLRLDSLIGFNLGKIAHVKYTHPELFRHINLTVAISELEGFSKDLAKIPNDLLPVVEEYVYEIYRVLTSQPEHREMHYFQWHMEQLANLRARYHDKIYSKLSPILFVDKE